jgi:hypothetical protein
MSSNTSRSSKATRPSTTLRAMEVEIWAMGSAWLRLRPALTCGRGGVPSSSMMAPRSAGITSISSSRIFWYRSGSDECAVSAPVTRLSDPNTRSSLTSWVTSMVLRVARADTSPSE